MIEVNPTAFLWGREMSFRGSEATEDSLMSTRNLSVAGYIRGAGNSSATLAGLRMKRVCVFS